MSYKAIKSSINLIKKKTSTVNQKKGVLTYNEYLQIKDLDELPDDISPSILLVPDAMTCEEWEAGR